MSNETFANHSVKLLYAGMSDCSFGSEYTSHEETSEYAAIQSKEGPQPVQPNFFSINSQRSSTFML